MKPDRIKRIYEKTAAMLAARGLFVLPFLWPGFLIVVLCLLGSLLFTFLFHGLFYFLFLFFLFYLRLLLGGEILVQAVHLIFLGKMLKHQIELFFCQGGHMLFGFPKIPFQQIDNILILHIEVLCHLVQSVFHIHVIHPFLAGPDPRTLRPAIYRG